MECDKKWQKRASIKYEENQYSTNYDTESADVDIPRTSLKVGISGGDIL